MQQMIIDILNQVGTIQAQAVGTEGGRQLAEQLNGVKDVARQLLATGATTTRLARVRQEATDQLEYLRALLELNPGSPDDVTLLNLAAAADTLAERTTAYLAERNRVSTRVDTMATGGFYWPSAPAPVVPFPTTQE